MSEENTVSGAPDRALVRQDYEGGVGTLDDICTKFSITRSQLQRMRNEEGWAPRRIKSGYARTHIIKRLFRLLERQIIQLETDMKQTGEKEVAVLGKLASTLEKLIEIEDQAEGNADGARAGKGAKAGKGKDMHELRNKLAERIEQLKRG